MPADDRNQLVTESGDNSVAVTETDDGGINKSIAGNIAVGGAIGESFESDEVQHFIRKFEDIQNAYLQIFIKRRIELQSLENTALRTIDGLIKLLCKTTESFEQYRLKCEIQHANRLLSEIQISISEQESTEKHIRLMISQYLERKAQRAAGKMIYFDINIAPLEGVDTEDDSDEGDTNRITLTHANQLTQAANSEEVKYAKAVVNNDTKRAGGAEEEPCKMEAAEQKENADGRFGYPLVTGKYTLAIKAHQLCPDSTPSDDSPGSEPDHSAQNATESASLQLQSKETLAVERVAVVGCPQQNKETGES